jgi:polysaccharide pyruvyl transferase WcaK-like protein
MHKNPSETVKIGILGTWGFGNMGDASVAEATVDGLKRHFPEAEIIAICQQPENRVMRHAIRSVSIFPTYLKNTELVNEDSDTGTETDHSKNSVRQKIIAYIKRFKPLFYTAKAVQKALHFLAILPGEFMFSLKILKTVRQLDLLAMSGSGQLNEEWGGPWRYPFNLFRWCLLARISGCKVAFLSVGAGEIISIWTRFFCSSALRLAHYRSVRDSRSKELLESWGVRKLNLVPDMAFSIKFDDVASPESDDSSLVVGINPIPYCDPRTWNIPDQEKYSDFIGKMASFCDWLVSSGHRLVFVPNDVLMDNIAIDDIIGKMDSKNIEDGIIRRSDVKSYADIYRDLASCDCVICCRFHGLLYSLMSSRPVVALAHHYKFFKLTEEMGQGKYCLDIGTFRTGELMNLFEEISRNRRKISDEIAGHRKRYADRVELQYSKMAEIVKG